jgi:hypothetical protein
VGIQHTT